SAASNPSPSARASAPRATGSGTSDGANSWASGTSRGSGRRWAARKSGTYRLTLPALSDRTPAGRSSAAGAKERQVLEQLFILFGGQIADRPQSSVAPAPLAFGSAVGGRQVSGLLHQRLVGHRVDLRQTVKHVGRGLPDLPILELAQIGVRDGLARGLFYLP